MTDDLAGLTAAAYAAALDPAMLAEWNGRVARWIGVSTTALTLIDRRGGVIGWQHIVHPDPVRLADYYRLELDRVDPQLPVVLSVTRSTIYHSAQMIDMSRPDIGAYFSFVNQAGIDQSGTAAMLIGGDRYAATLTAHNSVADGALTGERWDRLVALAPVVARAMALATLHGEKLAEGWWDARLAAAKEPAALFDADGRLLRATAAMAALLRAGDGLGLRGDRLVADDPPAAASLAALLGAAAAGGGARGTLIPRRSGRSPYIATAWPLMPTVRHLVPDRAAVLVTVIDPAAPPGAPVVAWRAAFDLTRRETEVAALLFDGHSAESAAAILGITVGTARVHVRHLLAKTRTTRQADLLRLLSRLG